MDIGDQDPRGEFVRPLPLARRRRPASNIAIEAILVTTSRGMREGPSAGGHQQQLIADLCRQPQSLAEIAAHMGVPLGEARALVADMATEKLLTLHDPTDNGRDADRAERLERVLDGLRNL